MEKVLETFTPTSRQHWREWLLENHAAQQSIWLIYHKKQAATPTLTWSEAVSEALCFGWIDSQSQPIDEARYRQFFSRRKPTSGWSKVNKEKVRHLLAEGRMAPAGLAAIETAKRNGSWTMLDEVEALAIPEDLAAEFANMPGASSYFTGLSRTDKRNLLQWLVLARRPATRQSRIAEIVALAEQQRKPRQFSGRKQVD